MSKYLYGFCAFILAFAILSVSVLHCTSISRIYASSSLTVLPTASPSPLPAVEYNLPYGGKVLPDNWLWYAKVLRDKSQYLFTTNTTKKIELALLYSDKRLGASLSLLEKKKPDLAISTLTKGEKYLEMASQGEIIARKAGLNTDELLTKLALASLRHRQIIEEKILPLTPEDLKPEVVKVEDYSKETYKICRDALNAKGITAPKDPFTGQ